MTAIVNRSGKIERVEHIPGDSCLSVDNNEKKRKHPEMSLKSYDKRIDEELAYDIDYQLKTNPVDRYKGMEYPPELSSTIDPEDEPVKPIRKTISCYRWNIDP